MVLFLILAGMGMSTAVAQDVVRVQHALGNASGDRNTATFASAPEEGNLLVAFTIFRLGPNASTSPESPGSGWELRAVSTNTGSGEWDRRGIAIWTKIAGSSEPTTITTTWDPSRNNDLVIMEFRNNEGIFGSFLGSTVANNGTSYQNTINSGNITNSTSGDYFVLSGLYTRGQISSVGWTGGLANTIIANGPQDHSYATAFNVQTTSDNITTTATPDAWVQMNLALIAFELEDTATKVRVETANDGTGSVVSAQDVASGNSLTVYAIGRNSEDDFIELISDADWSLENITGGVVSGDLVDNMDGTATFTGALTGTATIRAESGVLTATESGTITVIPGSPDATNSTISSDPEDGVLANGSDSSVITLTVRDSNNQTVDAGENVFIQITSGSGTLTSGPWTTNGSGVATATLTSSTSGTVEITGYLGSNNSGDVVGTSEVDFTAAAPVAQTASGVGTDSFNANWNASSSGVTEYRLDVSTQSNFSSFVAGYDNVNVGLVTTTNVTGLDPEITYYYRVRAVGPTGTSANSNSIEVTTVSELLPPDATNSTIAANPDSDIEADGSSESTITITVRDEGNSIMGAGEDVYFEITSGTGTLSSGPWSTSGNGTATATLTATTAGTVVVTGYLGTDNNGDELGTASVIFDPQTFTITGTITDGTDPLENVSVSATGGHSQTVSTNSSGVFTFTGVVTGSTNITITPSLTNYTFSPSSRSISGPVTSNQTNQNFTGTLITYTLTLYKSGDGSMEVNSSPYNTPVTVNAGTTLSIDAIPDSGWEFSNWSGDFSSTESSDTILMDEDKEVTANFNPEPTPGVSLRLQYNNDQTNQFGDIRPHMTLFNDGDVTLNFTDIKIRYWFVSDPPGLDVFNIDWAQIGTGAVNGNFGSIGGERYLEISFTSAAEIPGWKGGTGPNNFPDGTDSGPIQPRVNDDGNANYDQSLHYSWDPAFTSFADYEKITVYHQGSLVWGTPPDGGSEAEDMIITQQPTTSAAGATISPSPTVKLEDALGEPVQGVEITATINNNSFKGGSTTIVTTNSSGLAVFDNLAINTAASGYQITFDADAPLVNNRTSGAFTINASTAADMTITQQPPGTITAGSAITPAPSVTIVDEFGNPKSGVSVTVSLNKNSFASGTTTISTNSSGGASFSNLIINQAATNYIITFNADAAGIDDLNSNVLNVNAAAASNMTITTQPGESVAEGIISGPPTVNITDNFGNPISGINVTVSETGNSYTFDAGTLTKSTNSSGNAAFNDLQIDTPDTEYRLTFDADAAGVSDVNSDLFDVIAAGGTMTVTQQPSTTEAGEIITPAPSITLLDGLDDPIEGVNVTVSLNKHSFASGTLTVATNSSGVAVFNDLVVETADTDYQILFDADLSGVSDVFSNNFEIQRSVAASMSVTIQPNNSVAGNVVAGPPTVTIVDDFGNPVPGIDISVSLNNNSFDDGTYTVASDSNGEAVFNDLVIETAATAYQIIFDADASGVSNINTNNFNITAAAASSMSITTQPGTSTAGVAVSPNPVVLVVDAFGNPKSGVDVTASLNKSSFAGGSTLIVTSNSSGEAIFNNLKINTTDTGYEITFNAPSISAVTTNPFEVIQPDPDFGSVELEYRVIETDNVTNAIRFGFRITNKSGVDLTLEDLEIRYWLTSEPPGTDSYTGENVSIGAGNISGVPGVIEGEEYMGLFISSDAVISVGQGGDGVTPNFLPDQANTGVIEGRINDSAWGNYTQSDDYSFDSSVTSYATFQQINVYYKGILVWGEQPAAVEGGVELEFNQQPTETVQSEIIDPPVTVRILDRDGNLVSNDDDTEVTISIENDPSTNATLNGTTTVTAVSGVATFNNLSINNVGFGYTLRAIAADMDEDTSASFDILSAVDYTISGTILDGDSNPVSDVTVTATGGHSGSTTTDINGEYSITDVEWGSENVTITPVLSGYTFDPTNINISGPITDNVSDQDFEATVESGTYYSRATGNWDNASNWSTDSHAGSAAGRAPVSTDEIIIGGGFTITLNLATFTLDNPGTLNVNDTGVLVFTGEDHIAGTGSFTLASGGGLTIGSTNGITSSGSTGNIRTTTRTFNPGANFTYNGNSAQVTGNGLPQEVNDLRINNSNNVRSSASVQVDGTLYLEEGTFIMSDGLSLIANTKDIDSGQLQYELEIGGQQGYRLLASPLNVNYSNLLSEVITQGFTGASLTDSEPLQPNVLWYDETYEGTDNQRWRAPADISDNVIPGRGYHVYMFGDIASDSRYNDPFPYTLIVNGQENEGTEGAVDLNVTYTENGDTGWNLVGNPFGAYIDWDDNTNWTKTNIDASIYIWDPNSNQYKTWNGSAGDVTDGIIAPFQGFWVKANATSPDLVVSSEAKTLDAGAGFVGKLNASKGRHDASISIMAYHSDHLHSTAHFSFTDDGRLGMDSRDAHRLLPPPDVKDYLEFYSRVDDKERLAVNNLPGRFGRPIEIPLELNAYLDGSAVTDEIWLKIDSFKNVPSDWVMELMNEITGEKLLIMEGDSIRISMAHMEGRNVELTNSTGKVTTKSPMAHVSFTLTIHPELDAYGLNHEFTLHQNYPNPFNPSTTLEFDLPIPGTVRLEVYDIIGRRVAVLVNDNLQAGNYKYVWDASGLSSGIYIARLVTADGMFTRKLTVIK